MISRPRTSLLAAVPRVLRVWTKPVSLPAPPKLP